MNSSQLLSTYVVGSSSGSSSDIYFKLQKGHMPSRSVCLGIQWKRKLCPLCHFTANMNDEAKMTL